MLEWLCEYYVGEIHVSFGMTTHEEEERVVQLFESKGRNKDVVVYSCTSGYPVPFHDVSLLEITRLQNSFGDRVKEIGFSGHHLGIAIDIAAYTLGATAIERHYTLDRTWKGTDHAASLEPDGIRKLRRNLDATWEALAFKQEEILPIEQVQRTKLKYRKRNCDHEFTKNNCLYSCTRGKPIDSFKECEVNAFQTLAVLGAGCNGTVPGD